MIKRVLQNSSLPELGAMTLEWSKRRLTSERRTVPDFLIIGAQRCGTTSLYKYMVEHPNIIPAFRKETHFFDRTYRRGIDFYRAFFPMVNETKGDKVPRKITGEATPIYLFHSWVPKRVATWLPNVKIIILLRNPVDRAYSHYQMNIRLKIEDSTFENAVRRELKEFPIDKTEDPWLDKLKANAYAHYSYTGRGVYIHQIKRWLDYFPREQFLFLKSEDFFNDPPTTMKTVYDFLDINDFVNEDLKPHNVGSYNALTHKFRTELEEFFEPFNQNLYLIAGKHLNWGNN